MMNFYVKTGLGICTVVLLLTGAAHAQTGHKRPDHFRGPPDAEQRVAHLSRALDLSDEQSVRLLEVFQAADEEKAVLHEMAREQMKPQICALRLGVEAELREILTPQQLSELDEIKAGREPTGRGRRAAFVEDMDCSAYQQDGP